MSDEQFKELKSMFQQNSEWMKKSSEIIENNSKAIEKNGKDIAELKTIVMQNSEDIKKNSEAIKKNSEAIKKLQEDTLRQGILFEHEYGDKITAIFDKLMLNDEISQIKDEEFIKFKTRFEYNDTLLMVHDTKIAALEEKVAS